jgi:hypothetical protein
MRFIALALIGLSLPLFLAWLRARPRQRHHAMAALALMLFLGGQLQIDAALITWPLWTGTVRGIVISPVDTLALALIFTRRNGIRRLAFTPILLLYLAVMALSITAATVALAPVFACFQFLRAILLFVAMGGEFARPRALPSILTGLSLGLLVQAGYVIWQKLSGVVQATGTMTHQNTLGIMTELAVIPLAAAILEGDRRMTTSAGVVAGLIVVAGGGSRGAMAFVGAALVTLAVLSVARRPTARKMKVLGLGLLGLAVMVPLGLATLHDRFGEGSFDTEEEQRAAFERSARAMSADYPFGVGANLFVSVNNLQGYAERAGVAWNHANRSAPVHNAYLLARAETGWTGLIAFSLLFLVSAGTAVVLAFADRRNPAHGVVLGSGVAIAAVALHNFYEFAVHTYHPQVLLIANMAIIGGYVRVRRLSSEAARQNRPTDPALPNASKLLDAGVVSASPGSRRYNAAAQRRSNRYGGET